MNNKKQNNEEIKTKINLLSKSFGFEIGRASCRERV